MTNTSATGGYLNPTSRNVSFFGFVDNPESNGFGEEGNPSIGGVFYEAGDVYTAPPLPQDVDLDAVFQKAIVGITGLEGKYVRPRWQPSPPKQPAADVNWCAIGVTQQVQDANAYIDHIGFGEGYDNLIRHEEIELMCTFYGTRAQRYASIARDGFNILQNIEELKKSNIVFVDAGDIRAVPELFNQQWIRRYDLTFRFRRQITRSYDTLNLLSAPFLINTN